MSGLRHCGDNLAKREAHCEDTILRALAKKIKKHIVRTPYLDLWQKMKKHIVRTPYLEFSRKLRNTF